MLIKAMRHLTILLMVTLQSGCNNDLELHRGLSEQDANTVVAELKNKGIAASKHEDKTGYAVLIPVADFSDAVKVLQSVGLPSQTHASLGDVFRKEGIISSPLEERARYIFALSQELEFTLSQIDGVIMARVHVVLPEIISVGEPIQPASAAVFIKYNPDSKIEALRSNIRRMVVSSIPGMVDSSDTKLAISLIPAEPYTLKQKYQKKETAYSLTFYIIGIILLCLSLYFFIPGKVIKTKAAVPSVKSKEFDQ